ncbi:hypothetical protein [Aeromicrobium ginsengisoli]|uniref:PH domain-containing protein n=1 Tax=Aeromicrobium ginsengisoli TaxID=363867 RepID=A0A5M4FGQ8_9ACTN|nr:hypothetical protein [Aeromicrobium ginsengisoli]KAA1398071.1 hypothetical protein ESP70_012135 [Aeromicrobium ginsengisoli]
MSSIIGAVVLLVMAGVFIWASVIENEPWGLLFAVFPLVMAVVFGVQARARLEIWPDRFVVRMIGTRAYRFDECSEFEAKTLPGLPNGGRVVRFVHAPEGEIKSKKFTRVFGYNMSIPKFRGGAKALARDLNQYRERWLASEGTQAGR